MKEERSHLREEKKRFVTALDLIKSLKNQLTEIASIFELPYNLRLSMSYKHRILENIFI